MHVDCPGDKILMNCHPLIDHVLGVRNHVGYKDTHFHLFLLWPKRKVKARASGMLEVLPKGK